MAGAGQPFYMPLTWPVGHVSSAIMKPETEDDIPKPEATPDLDWIGHLTSMFGASRSFLMAWFCVSTLYGGFEHYPGALGGAAKDGFAWAWMWPILARDLIACWTIAGGWDYFLYFSPVAAKLHKYKLNPIYPPISQMYRDFAVATQSMVWAAAVEIVLCRYWAAGAVASDQSLLSRPLLNAALVLTTTHWRIPHFWAIHRAMHPWKVDGFPDVGKFLYKHVHSLHHKSHNPTAFSGTNMHPVEATLYFSAALLVVPFGVHPAIPVGCIVDCAVGAWLGHDGFQWPGSGDYFHQLHHAHFDCNYGAMHVPVDKWLGTYAGCKEDVKRIWAKKKAGGKVGKDGTTKTN